MLLSVITNARLTGLQRKTHGDVGSRGSVAECIAERPEAAPAYVVVTARDLPLTALIPAIWRHFNLVPAFTILDGHINLLSSGSVLEIKYHIQSSVGRRRKRPLVRVFSSSNASLHQVQDILRFRKRLSTIMCITCPSRLR